jgi:hypothetical protein
LSSSPLNLTNIPFFFLNKLCGDKSLCLADGTWYASVRICTSVPSFAVNVHAIIPIPAISFPFAIPPNRIGRANTFGGSTKSDRSGAMTKLAPVLKMIEITHLRVTLLPTGHNIVSPIRADSAMLLGLRFASGPGISFPFSVGSCANNVPGIFGSDDVHYCVDPVPMISLVQSTTMRESGQLGVQSCP